MSPEMLRHLQYTHPRLADVTRGSKRAAAFWGGSWRPDRTRTGSKMTLNNYIQTNKYYSRLPMESGERFSPADWLSKLHWLNCISIDYGGSTDFQHTLLNVGFLILNWIPLHPDFDSKSSLIFSDRKQDKTPCIPFENGKYQDQILMLSDLLQIAFYLRIKEWKEDSTIATQKILTSLLMLQVHLDKEKTIENIRMKKKDTINISSLYCLLLSQSCRNFKITTLVKR